MKKKVEQVRPQHCEHVAWFFAAEAAKYTKDQFEHHACLANMFHYMAESTR